MTGVLIGTGTTAVTVKANPVGSFVGTSDVQNIDGAKRFLNLTLQMANPLNTATTTIRNPVVTADSVLPLGKNQYHIVFFDSDDSLYKVIDGTNGVIISSDAGAYIPLQYALTNVGGSGGRIFVRQGTYDIGANTLTYTLGSGISLDFGGAGHATSIRKLSGTGDLFATTGTSSSHQYLNIHDINFQGGTGSITATRNGLNMGHQGPTTYLDNVSLKYFDIALNVTDTNSIYSRNLKIQVVNTGVKSVLGPNTEPNALKFDSTFIGGAVNYGFDLWSDANGTGSVAQINGADFGQCGVGIKVSGAVREIVIGPSPIYMEQNTVVDIWIAGTSTTVYPRAVDIQNVRCSGTTGVLANMIKLDFCGPIKISNCVAFNYTDAMILCNAATNHYKLNIINPLLDGTTPYLINTPSDNFMTSANDRIFGTVTEPHRQGQILSTAYTSLIEGSVVTWKGGNNVVNLVTVADDTVPGVVMYPCPASTGIRPVVVCTKGITLVNMDAATTTADTITTSATTRKGRTNNAAVDPKIILGYALQTTGAAGLCYARII